MSIVRIMLDAGHYGKYNHSEVVPALYESDFNWKFHLLLKKYLEEYGIEVGTTRKLQKDDMDLYDRGRCAKGYDLFLSIHANWASRESADYPVCYVPISGKVTDLGTQLAKCIEQVMGTKEYGRANTKQSTKGPWDWYGVIYGAAQVNVPGIIIEHSFYSNKRSAEWLMVDANLDKMARAEADVIAAYFNVTKPVVTPVVSTTKNVYRAISGAYTLRTNADVKLATVKKIYPDAIMIQDGGYFKIQIGEYATSAEANAKVTEVKLRGLDCYVSIGSVTVNESVTTPPVATPTTVYRAISGAYTSRKNADTKLETVRKHYPDAIMIKAGNYYKIQIAEFTTSTEASKKRDEAKAKGLDCYVSKDASVEVVVGKTTTSKPAVVTPAYTHEQFVRDLQIAIGAKVDGKAGPETLSKTPTLSRYVNSKHAAVKPVQRWMYELGYTEIGTVDGIAGAKFEQAVKRFQKEKGRNVDGELTAKQYSWKVLLELV